MDGSDKRSVTTDALDTLGTFIDENQKRDAIHLAVEPVIAGEELFPGCHIDVKHGIATRVKAGTGLGIVDPFLIKEIEKGARFWFVMYPRQVRSLRHVWTHPAFPDEPVAAGPADKAASEAWLRAFCDSADCPRYDEMIALLSGKRTDDDDDYTSCHIDDEYLHFSGTDAHGEIPPEFWRHVETVLGCKFVNHPTSFSCSC
jgi:hypothetical protein